MLFLIYVLLVIIAIALYQIIAQQKITNKHLADIWQDVHEINHKTPGN